jgi:hypothetical protein
MAASLWPTSASRASYAEAGMMQVDKMEWHDINSIALMKI